MMGTFWQRQCGTMSAPPEGSRMGDCNTKPVGEGSVFPSTGQQTSTVAEEVFRNAPTRGYPSLGSSLAHDLIYLLSRPVERY